MKSTTSLRVILSHRPFLHVIAIATALMGCGGVVATSPDASATGCPASADIQTQAAVGKACGSDGLYCPELSCDPCTQNCHAVSCNNGVWTSAINTGVCSVDAGACMTIAPSSFDQSCTLDSDCMAVSTGTFCSGQPWCMCPSSAINVNGKAQYDADVQALKSLGQGPGGCGCPFLGSPRCIGNVCTVCGGPNPCPDGG